MKRTALSAILFFAALAARGAEPKFALTKGGGVYVAEGAAGEPKLVFDYKSEFASPHFLGFSPDGTAFVMSAQSAKAQKEIETDPEGFAEMLDSEIFYQAPDGKRERIPATGDCFAETAVFSPDGKRIAIWYADLLNGYAAIELWSPGAQAVKKILPSEGWEWPLNGIEGLAWAPDSRSIWRCEERRGEEATQGRIMRYSLKDGNSTRYAAAPEGRPLLSSLIATPDGPIALAAKDGEMAGTIAYAEPREGKGPVLKALAEPAAEEMLALPGGKAVAIDWEKRQAHLYDSKTKKAEKLAKFDLQGMTRSWKAYGVEIGGAPAVAFRAMPEEPVIELNILLNLKTGEWQEIYKGYRMERVWNP